MFIGKYTCTLDRENRLIVPPAVMEQLSGYIYVTQGFDRNLLILTMEAFQEIYHRIVSFNITDPLARLLLRLILGSTHKLETEGDANITIPEDLRAFANLWEEVLLIGQGDYFEIWSIDLWKEQDAKLRDVDSNADRFSELTVCTR